MTKTNMKKSNSKAQHRLPLYRRAWFLALVIILIITAIVCSLVFLVKPSDQSSTALESADSSGDATTEKTVSSEANENDGQHINTEEPYSDPDQITIQYEGENPNRASELSGSITYKDYQNSVLSIGTMIDQYLREGTCELKLTGNHGNVYTTSSAIIAAASTSACYDLSVNVVPDHYQIEITINSNNKQGIITDEVEL